MDKMDKTEIIKKQNEIIEDLHKSYHYKDYLIIGRGEEMNEVADQAIYTDPLSEYILNTYDGDNPTKYEDDYHKLVRVHVSYSGSLFKLMCQITENLKITGLRIFDMNGELRSRD